MFSPALKERLRKQGRAYVSPICSRRGSQSCNASFEEVNELPRCASEAGEVTAGKASGSKGDVNRGKENLVQRSPDSTEEKRDVLRRLRIVERYREEEALTKVEELIPKWLKVCQDVAQRLWNFLPEPRPSLAAFLRQLHVDLDLIKLDEAEDSFRL